MIECICGLGSGAGLTLDPENPDGVTTRRRVDRGPLVACELCAVQLHARCVNYDLGDAHRGRFLCPHCHVGNVSSNLTASQCYLSIYVSISDHL